MSYAVSVFNAIRSQLFADLSSSSHIRVRQNVKTLMYNVLSERRRTPGYKIYLAASHNQIVWDFEPQD